MSAQIGCRPGARRIIARWCVGLRAVSSVSLLVVCSQLTACNVATATDRTGVADGRDTYVRYGCHECHGFEGQGGGAYGGPRIAPQTWPLEAFTAQVRRPRGSPFAMPAYSPTVLDDAELARIYEYLRGISGPPRKNVQSR